MPYPNMENNLLVGLFGHPVHHSKSPAMHQAAFAATGIQGHYQAFDIPEHSLKEALQAIRVLDMRGVNVTIPHKVAIIKYMDELTPAAAKIGAVNTVIHKNGKLIGTNTDGSGYVRSLQEELTLELSEMNVLIIGAGGAARAIATQLALTGVKSLTLTNRTYEKAAQLAETITTFGQQVQSIPISDIQAVQSNIQIVINTTSVGMYPNSEQSPIPQSFFQSWMVASDLVYNPRLTTFLRAAQQRGCRTHEGIGMLVYQGAEAFRLWTGVEAPVQIMRQALLDQL